MPIFWAQNESQNRDVLLLVGGKAGVQGARRTAEK